MGGENNKDWAKFKDCPQTFVSGEGNTTVASRSIASSNENIIKVLGRVGFTLRDRILITNFRSVPGRPLAPFIPHNFPGLSNLSLAIYWIASEIWKIMGSVWVTHGHFSILVRLTLPPKWPTR